MEINSEHNMYMPLLYVYLKSYEEAIDDFEEAVKNIGWVNEALMAVKQKFAKWIDRVSSDLLSGE